jgi:type VI secretion system secreted protein VgrG
LQDLDWIINTMSAASQKNRQVQVATSLGGDKLMFHTMVAREGMSQLYELELELYSNDAAIEPEDLLGTQMTVGWTWDLNSKQTRYFTGIVVAFGLIGGKGKLSVYRCVLAPPMWLLTQNVNSRIFKEKKTSDIIKSVLSEYGITASPLEGLMHIHEYCVQWQESDYAFICRLMERHGAYFFFDHDNGETKLSIVEAGHKHAALEWHATLQIRDPGESKFEHIWPWGLQGRIRPNAVTVHDYDFNNPRADMAGAKTLKRGDTLKALSVYSVQAGHPDKSAGDKLANIAAQSYQADALVHSGAGNARAISPGHTFEAWMLKADSAKREYELLAVSTICELREDGYETGGGGGDTSFTCSMTAVPKTAKWRAPITTPWPRIYGPQTAVVKNLNSKEIEVDDLGRVRVQFDWEREDLETMQVRVSQMWAGASFGGAAWPRNGHEVIVEHLNGDPDRPIITGRVYNAKAKPPHDLSEGDTDSIFSIKSRSIGGTGFNSLDFQDKKSGEYVFLHSQKDTHLRTTEMHFELIGKDEHQVIKGDAKRDVAKDLHEAVKGDAHLTVGGANNVKVTGDHLVSSAANLVAQASMNVHLKGGANVVIEAGTMLTLKAGGSFVTIGPAGVDIKGVMVKVNSGGAAGPGAGTKAAKAKKPDEPMEGKPAKTAPAAAKRDWKAVAQKIKGHDAAAALAQAAKEGKPFCEECEKARKEAAAGGA